ncbi:MAG: hypothetical protein BMS9Abin37_3286 [Acidobacteriota bacterium]|nr:MAG: hypothetical protein BMS9Abin37_3286 [Acidobacteriota bacterium]
MTGKLFTMSEAIDRFVDDGHVVAAESFTPLIPFAAKVYLD